MIQKRESVLKLDVDEKSITSKSTTKVATPTETTRVAKPKTILVEGKAKKKLVAFAFVNQKAFDEAAKLFAGCSTSQVIESALLNVVKASGETNFKRVKEEIKHQGGIIR